MGALRLGRNRPFRRRGCRTPLAAPAPLPVLRGGSSPYAVNLIVGERELQALLPHLAPGADYLGLGDLPFPRACR